MADQLADLRYDIALANRMLAHHGVLDAFGHVSARHPHDPQRYLLSRSRAPELVEPDDILEYSLDSRLVKANDTPLYSERVIHGEIYKARPDVNCVVHHHAPDFMPLVITGIDYVPVFHLGAVGGANVPFWDQREEFGDTNLLVVKAEEGASLARRLGQAWMVLMNRHGVTVAGTSVREAVFRCVFSCLNARFQIAAAAAGRVGPLSAGEVRHAFTISTGTTGQARSWELWVTQLAKAGSLPRPVSAPRSASAPRKPRATAKAARR